MKHILLLSDTHSHIDDTIIKYVKQADEVWHAGDIGDLKVTKKYASNKKNKYIEYINLNKSFDKKSIKILAKYFDEIFNLGEILFKSTRLHTQGEVPFGPTV